MFSIDAVDEEDAWDAVMGCADPGAPGLLLSGSEWQHIEDWVRKSRQRGLCRWWRLWRNRERDGREA